VARQAEQIDVAHFQQMHVGRTVRRVADLAPFGSHRLVLVNERSPLVGVAVVANLILSHRSAQLVRPLCAVRIMAIRTLHETFIHAVPEWHRELRTLLLMAAVAELRLGFDQQEFARRGVVGGMAGGARNIAPGVQRVDRMELLRTAGVATQALRVDCLGSRLGKKEEFGSIRRVCYVVGCRTVARFTALLCRTAACVVRGLPMPRLLPTFIFRSVAVLARVGTRIAAGGRLRNGILLGLGWKAPQP